LDALTEEIAPDDEQLPDVEEILQGDRYGTGIAVILIVRYQYHGIELRIHIHLISIPTVYRPPY